MTHKYVDTHVDMGIHIYLRINWSENEGVLHVLEFSFSTQQHTFSILIYLRCSYQLPPPSSLWTVT